MTRAARGGGAGRVARGVALACLIIRGCVLAPFADL